MRTRDDLSSTQAAQAALPSLSHASHRSSYRPQPSLPPGSRKPTTRTPAVPTLPLFPHYGLRGEYLQWVVACLLSGFPLLISICMDLKVVATAARHRPPTMSINGVEPYAINPHTVHPHGVQPITGQPSQWTRSLWLLA